MLQLRESLCARFVALRKILTAHFIHWFVQGFSTGGKFYLSWG